MRGVSAWFFGSAVVYGILGMLLGNIMGVTQDHSQLVTHAHMLLIGWVSFAIFGFFYHLFPGAPHRSWRGSISGWHRSAIWCSSSGCS
jgi:hypothetical protein